MNYLMKFLQFCEIKVFLNLPLITKYYFRSSFWFLILLHYFLTILKCRGYVV